MPVTKVFEHSLAFQPSRPFALPLVPVQLQLPGGRWAELRFLFDTGAAYTILRHDLHRLLGAPDWRSGTPVAVGTAGSAGEVLSYRYEGKRLRLLGRVIECPIHLMELPWHPAYVGLLGREGAFEHFGFGFWEKDGQLLVTPNP